MSTMTQYTVIRPCDRVKGQPDTYSVHLLTGSTQSLTVGPPLPLDEARWMCEQLEAALERIVKEQRSDPTW